MHSVDEGTDAVREGWTVVTGAVCPTGSVGHESDQEKLASSWGMAQYMGQDTGSSPSWWGGDEFALF